ncbi:FecR domain-containing protein [Acinetobacter gerneri]|uniref:FecR domain-containing protein n=1 Tax=Acinetobacter gerneri TaxID=202952 RepID=A0AAW8JHX0_9GAMM|nr:FecR domain-containing protein [Acinetobacter gerneri]MDQ9010205.1 FecR domain-containing protein [Acinetobacter gerneri]MDQ9014382.1 FecR domain-containing protein [Acinetobacter gerneri]MDQ9025553.1 FecR domain-containing protein [Acinetobacter gerneri]MDQ9052764.1 FecR domain-containing protein [Acinetobacter gerneri]MDQ9060452.1 FecR domain-containing protein [Acinetobacter gerneri]
MNTEQLRKELALWAIRLNSDDPDARREAEAQFKEWRKKYPQYHEQMEEMQRFSEQMHHLSTTHGISSQNIQNSVQLSQQGEKYIQKMLAKTFVFSLCVGAVGYLSYSTIPFAYYTADLKTKTGEMQSFVLDDGSKITLGAKSAIKLDFTQDKREIDLVQGDLYIEVAKDKNRPLIVHTEQADFKALGTRFIVNEYHESSSLSMLDSKVLATSLNQAHQSRVVKQGQKLNADLTGLGQIAPLNISATEMAWDRQQILAEDLALSDLLTLLSRYHQGYLFFNKQALSQFKVNGVINARQDLDQTLSLLQNQYPQLKVHRISKNVRYISIND